MKLHIKGGRLIDPATQKDEAGDLFVADGRIVGAGGTAPAGFVAESVLDARGCVVCPGLVDLCARLREPGYEHKATLDSEMRAAVAGGVTRLACPPDTDPPLDEPGLVQMLAHRSRQPGFARVHPVGALTLQLAGERLTEMAELAEAGCIAFGQANRPVLDTQVLMRALQYAASFGFTVWLPAQDPYLSRRGVAHDGEVAARLGLPGIPAAAETIALATILHLVRETGARVHIPLISSAAGVDMIAAAKREGLPITCSVSINHLHLTEMDIGYFNPHARLDPPLRSQRDRDALRAALAAGVIDALCSDHTPVDDDAKQVPFEEAEVGATGLELLLPATLKWAQESKLSLPAALATITTRASAVLGLPVTSLAAGATADLCIFDPNGTTPVRRELLRSQGKNTPLLGFELPGKVRYTLVGGQLAFDGGL